MTNGPKSKGHSLTNNALLSAARFRWWKEHSSNGAILTFAIPSILFILAFLLKQYLQQHMQPFARRAYVPDSIALWLLHDEQEVLSVLRNSSPLSHLFQAFLALGATLQVALSLGLVVFFVVGFWVALVLSCLCNLSSNSFLTRLR